MGSRLKAYTLYLKNALILKKYLGVKTGSRCFIYTGISQKNGDNSLHFSDLKT